jgi:hypothetical protein
VATLRDITEAIKSANAGASWLTFDLVFPDMATLDTVWNAQVLSPALFHRIYGVDPDSVELYRCDAINTIKVTIPRHSGMGGPDETDFDGVQQFAPLLDIAVPGAVDQR